MHIINCLLLLKRPNSFFNNLKISKKSLLLFKNAKNFIPIIKVISTNTQKRQTIHIKKIMIIILHKSFEEKKIIIK